MIEFQNIHKTYRGGHTALGNLSFNIAAGEFVHIAGHSGAGKTSLLKLIAAIERPTSGILHVNGQNISRLKSTAVPYLRRNLGITFQDQKLLFDRSTLDNVLLPLLIVGTPLRDAAKRARAALDKVGLLNREKANPITLSGGDQQRLAIARAIVNRPTILLADEPTANLDRDSAQHILNIFQEFNRVGVTVLIATHDETLMQSLSNNTPFHSLRLQHGALVDDVRHTAPEHNTAGGHR